MNIYRYSWKSFRRSMNKGVIFMISLAVMLISAVLHIAFSFYRTAVVSAEMMSTNAHVIFQDLTQEQAEVFSDYDTILWDTEMMGTSVFGEVPGADEPMPLVYMSNLRDMAGYRLTQGYEPVKKNDAAMSKSAAKEIGLQGKVGETFSADIQEIGITEFTITGILEDANVASARFGGILFVSKPMIEDLQQDEPILCSKYVRFKDANTIEENRLRIIEDLGLDESCCFINEFYISAEKPGGGIIAAVIGVLAVLMFTGAVVIYNAYNIIVVKRTHELGMLTLVGGSKRQIRQSVYLQALFSGGAGIPLGLILGFIPVGIAIPMLSRLFGYQELKFYISPWVFILTVALAAVMVLLGTMRPAMKAAAISPVEAVKAAPIPEKYRQRKEEEFLDIKTLGKLNMGRNRGRSVSTIAALSISGVLFLSISTVFMSVINSLGTLAESWQPEDIILRSVISSENMRAMAVEDQLTQQLTDEISEIDGVEMAETVKNQIYFTKAADDAEFEETNVVIGMEEDTINRLAESFEVDGSTDLTGGNSSPGGAIPVIAINRHNRYSEPYSVSKGQTMTIYSSSLNHETGMDFSDEGITVFIAGVVDDDDFPSYIAVGGGSLPELLMPMQVYDSLGFDPRYKVMGISIDEEKHDQIMTEIKDLCTGLDEIDISSALELKEELMKQIMGIMYLLFLGVGVVIVIGIINLSSTIIIGIQQRKWEFGVLTALGLSPKGLRKLLSYETMRICGISLGVSVVLGIGLGGLFYAFFTIGGDSYISFSFPFVPLSLLAVIYTMVPLILTQVSAKQLRDSTPSQLLNGD